MSVSQQPAKRESITSTFKTNSWIFSALFKNCSVEDAIRDFVSRLDACDAVNVRALPGVEEAFVDIFIPSIDKIYVGDFSEIKIDDRSINYFSSRGLFVALSIYK